MTAPTRSRSPSPRRPRKASSTWRCRCAWRAPPRSTRRGGSRPAPATPRARSRSATASRMPTAPARPCIWRSCASASSTAGRRATPMWTSRSPALRRCWPTGRSSSMANSRCPASATARRPISAALWTSWSASLKALPASARPSSPAGAPRAPATLPTSWRSSSATSTWPAPGTFRRSAGRIPRTCTAGCWNSSPRRRASPRAIRWRRRSSPTGTPSPGSASVRWSPRCGEFCWSWRARTARRSRSRSASSRAARGRRRSRTVRSSPRRPSTSPCRRQPRRSRSASACPDRSPSVPPRTCRAWCARPCPGYRCDTCPPCRAKSRSARQMVYFEFDQNSDFWRRLPQSAGLALHVTGELREGMEMECWAVRG